jgi:hypothetical protein
MVVEFIPLTMYDSGTVQVSNQIPLLNSGEQLSHQVWKDSCSKNWFFLLLNSLIPDKQNRMVREEKKLKMKAVSDLPSHMSNRSVSKSGLALLPLHMQYCPLISINILIQL